MTRTSPTQAMLLTAALLAPFAAYAASGPFANLQGAWSGGGTLTMASGETEQLRCRANYNVGNGGTDLKLNLRCASQSFTVDLGSAVVAEGGRISGTWSETSRNASGTISGRATAGHVEAAATGQTFSANLSLTTKGNRQTVSIRAPGTDIAGVSLELNRRQGAARAD